jgi:hypothetical protein
MRTSRCAALLLAFTLTASAQFDYTTNNGTITITRYTGPGGDVVIPSAINGFPVTCIGGFPVPGGQLGAFYRCASLTNILIPATVILIEPGAFWDCTAMTGAYFAGNAPSAFQWIVGNPPVTVYYLPWTSGWSPMFAGRRAIPWNPFDWLAMLVADSGLHKTIPLTSSLLAAQSSVERGNASAATNQLRAFQNKVRAQVRDANLARELIEASQHVIDSL